ncbi:MAG: tetratricopeptide repeat protein [Verrucomicrobiae bacterium]|nr:tetratricopeptide repeat protein [Verrucomicrobiae bacterium]
MRVRSSGPVLIALALCLLPFRSPAPLIYRPGEGWTYEPVGGARWRRDRAKDQLETAQEAFDEGKFRLASRAAKRVTRVWPLSDFAPQAQYLLGRAYEERGRADRGFRAYQDLIERYPKLDNYEEVLRRQFDIATLYLDGKWFYLWGVIPLGRDRDKVVDMYEKIVRNGPYSALAPEAQMNIGTARERQREWTLAVRAYERAADRYNDQPAIAAEAFHRAGMALLREAREAEYDQSAAGKAIDAFTDFIALFPNDPRVPECRDHIVELYRVRAEGSYRIARYYERKRRLDGAVIYYAEVVDLYTRFVNEPDAPRVQEARERIADIGQRRSRQRAAEAESSVPVTPAVPFDPLAPTP